MINVDLIPPKDLDALIVARIFKHRVDFVPSVWSPGAPGHYLDLDDTTLYMHISDGYTGMIGDYHRNLNYALEAAKYAGCKDNWVLFVEDGKYTFLGREYETAKGCETPAMAVCRALLRRIYILKENLRAHLKEAKRE